MDTKITLSSNRNGVSNLCYKVNEEETKIDLTPDEEIELLRKISVIILTKLPPEVAHKHLKKFLKFA
jgi:hypothetical protein